MEINKEEIYRCLNDVFGHRSFRTNQYEIIQNTLKGNDSVVIMPTGIGKSLCYQLPALISEGTAIVISPLIALMKNQMDTLRFKAENEYVAQAYNSTLTVTQLRYFKEHLMKGDTKIVFISPESLLKAETIELFKKIKISFLAVDEAHCISEWGINFRPEYRKISHFVGSLDKRIPILALTATATAKVKSDIILNLELQNPTSFQISFNRPNLYYKLKLKTKTFDKDILMYIKSRPKDSGIVYCLSRKKVDEFSEYLRINNVDARGYHAGMNTKERTNIQEQFLNEDIKVIVATIAFGMGVDKPNVRYIIHHDFSKSLESYYQETGRAGRDGLQSDCIAYYSEKDFKKFYSLLKEKKSLSRKAELLMLEEVIEFCYSTICRRKQLLYYFEELFDEKKCDSMCDNCETELEMKEVKDEFIRLLDIIKNKPTRFKLDGLIHALVNKPKKEKAKKKDKRDNNYGEPVRGTDYNFWRSIIRFALVNDFISKSIDNDYSFYISERGEEYLSNPYVLNISMSKKESEPTDHEDLEDVRIPGGNGGQHFDPALYSILERRRKTMSQQYKVPPFVIFQDNSLEDMCVSYPTTMEQLTKISGVGISKARKYGSPLLELIKSYVEENDIEIIDDIQVRGSGSKSKLKIAIINAIDRKTDLIDFAESNNVEFDDLLSEIESILYSGTKINIDYFIHNEMAPDKVDEVYTYFRSAKSDSIDDAVQELGEDDFSHNEVRLVRIKFMSELAF